MSTFLDQRISERQKRLDTLFQEVERIERDISQVKAELRAYLDVRENLSQIAPAIESNPVRHASEPKPSSVKVDTPDGTVRLSSRWQSLLRFMVDRYPDPVTNDELRGVAEKVGEPISPDNLRSSLWNYVQRHMIERIENGVYRITPVGAMAIGVLIPQMDGEASNDQAQVSAFSFENAGDRETDSGGQHEADRRQQAPA